VADRVICVNCRYHSFDSTYMSGVIWAHRCHHPEVVYPSMRHPVTGMASYRGVNEQGKVFYSDNRGPACTSVNVDGECNRYDPLD
jgi:hypothetical protein